MTNRLEKYLNSAKSYTHNWRFQIEDFGSTQDYTKQNYFKDDDYYEILENNRIVIPLYINNKNIIQKKIRNKNFYKTICIKTKDNFLDSVKRNMKS